jgi:Domain of unknown function (DUF4417)
VVVPEASLGGTRSSRRWQEQPGNWDRLNTRALFAGDGAYGIPLLPAAEREPARLVAYNDRWRCREPRDGDCVHWFLDDYRFESVWNLPERLERVARVGMALTPDFSLWLEMPPAMQLWQVYRSRWCGAWMASHGIDVIPAVSWSDQRSHAFAFAGIAQGSVVAVSGVGVQRDREARKLFAAGLDAMTEAIEPAALLCYGRMPVACGCPVREYPTRWDR